jgi:hypothetical protein
MENEGEAETPSEAERAIRRLDKRAEARERARQEEGRITAIVTRAVDRRVVGWLALLSLYALLYWKGWIGFGIWILGLVAWAVYEMWAEDRTPGNNADTAQTDAEHYVRHSILADLDMRGELTWTVEDDEEGTGSVVPDNVEWATLFWTQLESVLPEFEQATPKARRKRLADAKARSLDARKQMMKFAAAKHAAPPWWARVEPDETRGRFWRTKPVAPHVAGPHP